MNIQATQQTYSPINEETHQQGNENIIEVRNLVKRYGQTTAVNNISLHIRKGEIFGLLGPNGAGKTTALEIIEGIRSQDSGEVTVFGLDVRRHRRAIQARIGVQLQATTLFQELTVRETIDLFRSFYPQAVATEKLLTMLSLQEKANVHPEELSGGQRQRLALALALVNDPALIFLDEPTTGLDPQSRRALWDTIEQLREEGKTIILTTHFMDEAQQLCDRIAILDHGEIIAQDTPAGLINILSAEATIECTLSDHNPELLDQLRTLPAVIDLRQRMEQTLLYTENVEQTLLALFQFTQQHAMRSANLQIHMPTLEDVFLKLTGRQLRP